LGDHQPEPDDPKCGATRRADRRRYRGTGVQGDLEIGQSAPPKDARFEATRSSIAGKAGDAGRRETGSLYRKRCKGEVRKTGRPGESRKPAARNDAKFGATRKSIAGTAKGLRKRGNSRNRSPGAAKERGVRGNPETRN